MEQELHDIDTVLAVPSRTNLYDFLSRYPDYEDDGINLDADRSSSARSSNDADNVLKSITSTVTVVPGMDLMTDQAGAQLDDRHTLTPDFDVTKLVRADLDLLTLDDSPGSGNSSNRSSKEPIFGKQKYKQTVSYL